MCAASAPAPIPLYDEARQYWQGLTDECKRYVECVNETLARNGIEPGGRLQCTVAQDTLQIVRTPLPSTTVHLFLNFLTWGPVIAATIRGQQRVGKDFLPQELEWPIAIDLDSRIVAIYDEGRSFSPRQAACYLKQHFHRCYPGISLPC